MPRMESFDKRKTSVREHERKTPSGKKTTVRKHDRTLRKVRKWEILPLRDYKVTEVSHSKGKLEAISLENDGRKFVVLPKDVFEVVEERKE